MHFKCFFPKGLSYLLDGSFLVNLKEFVVFIVVDLLIGRLFLFWFLARKAWESVKASKPASKHFKYK